MTVCDEEQANHAEVFAENQVKNTTYSVHGRKMTKCSCFLLCAAASKDSGISVIQEIGLIFAALHKTGCAARGEQPKSSETAF
ncbi:MAG: hypothetical protein IPP85_01265 [Propionivibrio sp.]|nr:hypothetical protein [Propionivibrio sp.]